MTLTFNQKLARRKVIVKEGQKLAFDVSVRPEIIGGFVKKGCAVVCCAKESETDHDFIYRAFLAGAEVIVSPDSDIGLIIDKLYPGEMEWLRWAEN